MLTVPQTVYLLKPFQNIFSSFLMNCINMQKRKNSFIGKATQNFALRCYQYADLKEYTERRDYSKKYRKPEHKEAQLCRQERVKTAHEDAPEREYIGGGN